MRKAIAYCRVSTERQQRSGLGIEAQRTAVAQFGQAQGTAIVAEYIEVETGKGAMPLTEGRNLQPRSLQLSTPNARSWYPNWIAFLVMSPLLQA